MKEIERKLKEYQQLAGNDDPQSEARKEELLKWFDEHQSPELKEIGGKWMSERMAELSSDVENIKQEVLRKQMSDEIYRMLPLSLIAHKYFGKSAAWLSQRINGSMVRGKTYTLTEEQKAVFNRATREIGQQIGSFQIA